MMGNVRAEDEVKRRPRKTVYYSFRPVLCLSWLVGVMPLLPNSDGRNYRWNKYAALYCFTWFLLYISSVIYTSQANDTIAPNVNSTETPEEAEEKQSTGNVPRSTVTDVINTYFNVICLSFIYLLQIAKLRHLPDIFHDFYILDEWKNGKGKLLFDTPKIYKQTILSTAAFTVAIILVTYIPSSFGLRTISRVHHIPWSLVIAFFFQDTVKLSSLATEAQFLSLCFMLRARFSNINAIMEGLQRFKSPWREQPDTGIKFFRSPLNLVTPEQEPFLLGRRQENAVLDSPLVSCLENLRLCHRQLGDAVDKLTAIYQVQLLLNIANCFISTVGYMYLAITSLRIPGIDLGVPLSGFFWGIHCLTRMILLSVVPAATSNQANLSRILVERINSRKLGSAAKEEISLYVSHMESKKNEFTICGLFTLNYNMVISIIVAVATYVVILMQFR